MHKTKIRVAVVEEGEGSNDEGNGERRKGAGIVCAKRNSTERGAGGASAPPGYAVAGGPGPARSEGTTGQTLEGQGDSWGPSGGKMLSRRKRGGEGGSVKVPRRRKKQCTKRCTQTESSRNAWWWTHRREA